MLAYVVNKFVGPVWKRPGKEIAAVNGKNGLEISRPHPNIGIAVQVGLYRIGRMATKIQEDGLLEARRMRAEPPRMYKVVLLNDDYTPMEFVITVLQRFFSLDTEQATRIMLKVHNEGRGVCGIFPRDIAATKVEQVSNYARQHQHPLACVMEEN